MIPKMCTTDASNKTDHWLRLLVGSSLSLSPLARPYSFFFPTLPPWEKCMWCWSGTTRQLRSRTSEKLGFLNMLGASESIEVIILYSGVCVLESWTGLSHGYRGMIAEIWYWKRRGIVFLRGYNNAFRFDIVSVGIWNMNNSLTHWWNMW